MSVSMAVATVNQSSLLAIVEARLYVLVKRRRWQRVYTVIRDGIVASEMMHPDTTDSLMALSECLLKNGF
jgi:hypothetical protein